MDDAETATIKTGALSFMLQMARFTGTAPLSFKVVPNGYRISVSPLQQAYCLFILTVFNIFGFLKIYLEFRDFKKRSDKPEPHSTILLAVCECTTCVFVSLIGYIGSYRMKNMIHHLNILEKIRKKINYDHKAVAHDKNLLRICYIIIIFYLTLIVSDDILSALRASVYDFTKIVSAVHYFEYFILLLLKFQIAVLNFEVYKVLLGLNEKLRYLLALSVKVNISSDAKTRVVNSEIRNLAQCYILICDVVGKINKVEGLYMFLIYNSFALFAVFNGYRFILAFNRPTKLPYLWVEMVIRCCWCIIVVVRMTFFVQPFHHISIQVTEMTMLLSKLTQHMTPSGSQVSIELDIMIKQVILNAPRYSPLGMQMLNRSLLTATFSAIITYLVFIIEIESKK